MVWIRYWYLTTGTHSVHFINEQGFWTAKPHIKVPLIGQFYKQCATKRHQRLFANFPSMLQYIRTCGNWISSPLGQITFSKLNCRKLSLAGEGAVHALEALLLLVEHWGTQILQCLSWGLLHLKRVTPGTVNIHVFGQKSFMFLMEVNRPFMNHSLF